MRARRTGSIQRLRRRRRGLHWLLDDTYVSVIEPQEAVPFTCKKCGCTNERPCWRTDPEGKFIGLCYRAGVDLCSRCTHGKYAPVYWG